jgi:hypothetical protein
MANNTTQVNDYSRYHFAAVFVLGLAFAGMREFCTFVAIN